MNTLKVVIADDHKLFRKGMRSLLESFERIGHIDEASNGKELLEMITNEQPHVILMDLQMPVMDGAEASQQVIDTYPDVKILVLTMYDDEKFILHMMEMGVHGYLLKNAEPEEVEKAIYSVHENDFYYNKRVTEVLRKGIMLNSHDKPAFDNQSHLTARESEVLNLICNEMTNQQIAKELEISRRTVEKIRSNLLEKVNAKNTVGLVRYAIDHGILV